MVACRLATRVRKIEGLSPVGKSRSSRTRSLWSTGSGKARLSERNSLWRRGYSLLASLPSDIAAQVEEAVVDLLSPCGHRQGGNFEGTILGAPLSTAEVRKDASRVGSQFS